MNHRIHRALAACLTLGLPCFTAAHAPAPETQVTPVIFAPGTISAPAGVDCATFSPDGNTAFFDQSAGRNLMIMVSHRVNGVWSTPQIAPFSGQWMDHDPAMAPDGSFLVFASNRPNVPGGKALRGGELWRVDRARKGWGTPVRLPDTVNRTTLTFAPNITADGSVYFQQRTNTPGDDFHLYRSQYRNGSYIAAVQLKLGNPGAHQLDPAIAPDQSFIVFDANYAGKGKPDRLYIAFREADSWGKPIDMGDTVNRYQPWGSHLGPDARTLYFTSNQTMKVSYPRSPEQARADLARMRAWDNGNNHIWSIPLAPWLKAHHAT